MSNRILKTVITIILAFITITGGSVMLTHRASLAKTTGHTGALRANPAQPAAAGIDITIDEVIAAGFSRPVQVTHAGDGSGRLFVVEQPGRIKIIKNGAVLATPFLDIAGQVACCGERGLLGLAFHPDYQNNGYFYINYTRDPDGATVIARYTVSGGNPDVADPASAQTILTIGQPAGNHNGGQLLFGPDGYLYIGMGDGGGSGDRYNHGQNINSLLGAMLRLDVDGGSPYAIPPDNPYVGQAGRDEIWAIGLRNPWRFSFDRATGDIYIGDVGQNQWEEVSFQAGGTPGGVNFGWRCREGAHNYNFSGNCGSLTLTDPIAEYNHTLGNAVTGGFVYRGSLYPALTGYYFYADYGAGRLWSIKKTGPNSWSSPEQELNASFLISAFGEDENGELYVVEYSSGNGKIRRLADANGPSPNLSTSTKSAATPYANPGEVVTYTLQLNNTGGPAGQTIFLTDTIPTGLAYVPGSLSATQGTIDDSQNPTLRWQGTMASGQSITLTYLVTATGAVSGTLVNQAQLNSAQINPLTLSNALHVPRPVLTTTLADFILPGTQPGQLVDNIPAPDQCSACHTESIYNKWRGSMMSQAGRDPLLWAALAVANNDAPNAGEYCLRCHTPKGWLEGRSHPANGTALQSADIEAGVACEVCHRLVDPLPSTTDEAVAIDAAIRSTLTITPPTNHAGSAMMIVDPQDRRRGPFSVTPPHTALKTDFLGQSTNAVTESRLCGTCHNVDNPVLSWDAGRNQFWPNQTGLAAPSVDNGQLFPIERTYDEWLNSQYATTGVYAPQFAGDRPDGMVASCQDCHMRRSTGTAAIDSQNPVYRDCQTTGCLPEHDLAGGNTWVPQILQDSRWRLHSPDSTDLNNTIIRAREMLQRAASVTVTLTTAGPNKLATVRVTNQTGHKLPTGYPEGRRIWINLKAYDGGGNLVYQSGAYDPATGILSQDVDIKIYEAKQGLTPELANLLKLPAGESFHFILNNTVIKDNRIPPRGYTQAAFDRPGLRPVGATYANGQYWDETTYTLPGSAERVVATLYYQTASKEYIDFLRANGGVDGATLGELWDTSKSPPEVMAIAFDPSIPMYLPLIFKE